MQNKKQCRYNLEICSKILQNIIMRFIRYIFDNIRVSTQIQVEYNQNIL